jgi:hypothetical protein
MLLPKKKVRIKRILTRPEIIRVLFSGVLELISLTFKMCNKFASPGKQVTKNLRKFNYSTARALRTGDTNNLSAKLYKIRTTFFSRDN